MLGLLIPLAVLNLALLAFGAHLVARAMRQMRHYDRLIHAIKLRHSVIGDLLE